jgi:WD40 repeat protein
MAPVRPVEPPVLWSPGQVVAGSYRVEERCFAGRTGVVDRVRHLGWQQDFAVRSPHPQLATHPEGVHAFVERALAWLDLPPHPHLCAGHFVRVLDGAPRIFTEYAPSGSIAAALRAGRCATTAEIVDVAVQVAWGLAAVHDAGLVHNDLRLTKVLRMADGMVKLLPGPVPGHRAGTEDRADDVWNLATLVLQMFAAGTVPLPADEALAAYVRQPPPGRPAMPAPVATLLRECLAQPPGTRPDVREVADGLVGAFQVESGEPYPRTVPQAAEHTADGLNNKALSLLELGRPDDAERYWQQALLADPRHPDTTYNQGLVRWRAGQTGDQALVEQLDAAAGADARARYLLGQVHLERGDAAAAATALAEAARSAPEDPEIAAALDTATRMGSPSTPHLLTGHTEKVWSVAITADGSHAISGSFDGTVRWWDLRTGECLHVLSGHRIAVTSVALTPDGSLALTCSADGVVCQWEPASGRLLGFLEGGSIAAALTPDGRYALTGFANGGARLWDLSANRWLRTLTGHTDNIAMTALSSDARLGVTCGPPNADVWDLTTGRCLATLTGDLMSVALSADGRRLLTGHENGEVKLWDNSPETMGRCLQTLSGHIGSAHTVAIAPDGRYGLSGGRDGTLRWWDLTRGRCLRTFTGDVKAIVSVAMTPDGRHAVSGGWEENVRSWDFGRGADAPWSHSRPATASDLTTRAAEFQVRVEQARQALSHADIGRAAAELRAARAVPGFARNPALLAMWRHVGHGGRRTEFLDARERGVLTGHVRPVVSVAMTPDGRHAVSGGGDASVRWWDLDSGTCLRTLSAHTEPVVCVQVTDEGRHALSSGRDRTLRWWDLDTGRCVRTLTGHTDDVNLIALTSDGLRVLSGSDDRSLRWWDLETGECLRTLMGHTDGVWSVAVTPDGRYGVSGSFDHTLRWWDLATGHCLGTFTGHTDTVLSVAITPDGRRAVSGGDGTVRLWDLAAGQCVGALTGHTDTIMSVAITPDGRHAVSGSVDATVRLWDLDTGTCLRVLTGHSSRIWSMAITPDANRALSGSGDTTMRLWDLDWDYEFS